MLSCAAKAGYQVEGIELAASAATIASQLGIVVHTRTLAQCVPDLRFTAYGVISYFHVLEHLYDPVTELLTARQALGQNGVLIIEVPYFGTLSWKLLGQKHRHFYRGHRSYFNPESLSKLLGRTGYTVVAWEKVPHFISMRWLLMRLGLSKVTQALPKWMADKPVRVDLNDMLLLAAKRA